MVTYLHSRMVVILPRLISEFTMQLPGPAPQYIMQVSNMFTVNFVFSPTKANTKRLETNLAL